MLERASPIFKSLARTLDPGGRSITAINTIAKKRRIVFEKLFYDLFPLCMKGWDLFPHSILDFM